MRIVFCGGGTGGHVYPALTVADALRERLGSSLELLYIGVRGRMDAELVARAGIPFRAVTAGPLRVDNPVRAGQGVMKLVAGAAEAYSVLGEFKADAVFATGGYGSVGVGIAARLRRLPLIVFLPDVAAGLAVKTLARIATRLAVTVPRALDAMPPGKTTLTGYPVRRAFFDVSRERARDQLGLHPALPVLLVAGGSTGATAINRDVAGWLDNFLRVGQIVHVSGQNDAAWLEAERGRLVPELQERYHLFPYMHDDFPSALAAADLAVMRAGASTLGELPAAGLPAVLVPGEFSDQAVNARYLEEEGAAVMLPQSRLGELETTVMGLLADGDRRRAMRDALGRLARPEATARLADLILDAAAVRQPLAAGAHQP
jgi:UDP-N-acetylglucosamine--N-acetylmuramyl-(pentapeptide) pyrophosphoryl-undecaprenol N-acetylglucosamine transferase